MGVFEMITVIVIAAMVSEMYKAYTKKDQGSFNQKKVDKEIDELKTRIEHLEAIVTDKEYQLKKEFENL